MSSTESILEEARKEAEKLLAERVNNRLKKIKNRKTKNTKKKSVGRTRSGKEYGGDYIKPKPIVRKSGKMRKKRKSKRKQKTRRKNKINLKTKRRNKRKQRRRKSRKRMKGGGNCTWCVIGKPNTVSNMGEQLTGVKYNNNVLENPINTNMPKLMQGGGILSKIGLGDIPLGISGMKDVLNKNIDTGIGNGYSDKTSTDPLKGHYNH